MLSNDSRGMWLVVLCLLQSPIDVEVRGKIVFGLDTNLGGILPGFSCWEGIVFSQQQSLPSMEIYIASTRKQKHVGDLAGWMLCEQRCSTTGKSYLACFNHQCRHTNSKGSFFLSSTRILGQYISAQFYRLGVS